MAKRGRPPRAMKELMAKTKPKKARKVRPPAIVIPTKVKPVENDSRGKTLGVKFTEDMLYRLKLQALINRTSTKAFVTQILDEALVKLELEQGR